MDPLCPLVQSALPPPRGSLSAGRPTPSPVQRPTGLAGLLNPSPAHPPDASDAQPPTPPPTAASQQPQQTPAVAGGDPWTSFFPQLPQTRRRRAQASPRTWSDPALDQVAHPGGLRTPSPYPRNASDPSPGPSYSAPTTQVLSVPPGGNWSRSSASQASADAFLSESVPQAIGWGGHDRKRKRPSIEDDDGAGSPGVRIAEPALPKGDANRASVTFYRQVAPRRTVGDEPILFVSSADSEAQSALLYPPPPTRQSRASYSGSQVASTPQSSLTSYQGGHVRPYDERSSPPDVPGLLYGSLGAEDSRQRIDSRGKAISIGSFSGSPDPSSSPLPLSLDGAHAGENSLRMSGLPSFDHVQQRRFPAFVPQLTFEGGSGTRHGHPDEYLASSPSFGQSWYPPIPVIHHHHHHYAAPSRADSTSSAGFDGSSARSSLSNPASHGPTTTLTTPSIGLVESPPGSSSRSRQGSGGSRDLGSPPSEGADRTRSARPRSSNESRCSASGTRTRPASFDQTEHEPKRRRAGSLSHNLPSGPTASNPQEPRRSSTPVDRRAASLHGRSDSSDYERHLDATPRAGERRPLLRHRGAQSTAKGPKQPELDRRYSDPISHHSSTTAMPALMEDRSASRTPMDSPGSSADDTAAIYAMSDGALSSKQRSARKRTDRPAPFAGDERTFTLGSPTKSRGAATEPHRPVPLPSMWLAPPDAGGDAAQEGPDGRHVRLPSLTEALRELEVREANRR